MNHSAHETEASFVEHTPCEHCGSRDNRAVYDDGHSYCFSCPEDTAYQEDDASSTNRPSNKSKRSASGFIQGEARGLRSRRITNETAKKFNYKMAKYRGKAVQVANYYDEDRRLVAQKVRDANKNFMWIGDQKRALPFGAHAFSKTGKQVVVTEGEIDAMAMSQAQNNKWPVISIACGAGPQVRKYIARHREYLRGFDKVILMFDQDEPGREAAKVAAEVIGHDKAYIAELPLKDPGEMIEAGRDGDLIKAMWDAKKYRPEGIVDLASLRSKIKKKPTKGLDWCFPKLTELTYGKRLGELVAVGAGTGAGKTDFLTQDMRHMIEEHEEKIGVFALEQTNEETGLRLVGKAAERPLHIPEYWDEGVYDEAWDRLVKDGQTFLYNSFGVNEWETVESKIEFLYHAEGVQYFYVDHLTAFAAGEEDERRGLERIMASMGGLVKKIPIHVTFVSHLATPQGTPHEEGGRVMIRHFKGSRSIGFWAHFMFGLERDQQAENDAIRTTTTFRILKDRYTGRGTGQVFYLGYDIETGMLYETCSPDAAEAHGFVSSIEDDPPQEEGADF